MLVERRREAESRESPEASNETAVISTLTNSRNTGVGSSYLFSSSDSNSRRYSERPRSVDCQNHFLAAACPQWPPEASKKNCCPSYPRRYCHFARFMSLYSKANMISQSNGSAKQTRSLSLILPDTFLRMSIKTTSSLCKQPR